jgi:uncharacterized protein with HEPN domain
MQLEVKKHLFDILEAARSIEDYTRGLDYSDYRDNGMLQAAVERKFESKRRGSAAKPSDLRTSRTAVGLKGRCWAWRDSLIS